MRCKLSEVGQAVVNRKTLSKVESAFTTRLGRGAVLNFSRLEKLNPLTGVTHLFYATRLPKSSIIIDTGGGSDYYLLTSFF